MRKLTGAERKYLRARAHHIDPIVHVGKHGLTDTVVHAVNDALEAHELIKMKFIDSKDKKKTITAEVAACTHSEIVGMIGHVAILFREQEDAEKQKIDLRKRP